MVIDPGFRLTEFRRPRYMGSAPYLEYRRKWSENPKRAVVAQFPLNLDVELNNTCNLACPFCVREFMDEGKGLMDLDRFMVLCREAKLYHLPAMKLNWRGEPTLHPRLAEMVYHAKKAGILEVMLNTNGTLLTKNLSKKLIDNGLDKIIFSIDSIDPDKYASKYRLGANLVDVLANLKTLIDTREVAGSDTPYVRVQKIDFPETRGEEYVDFFADMGVDAVAVNSYKEKDPSKVEWETKPCAQPFQRMFVTWRGEYRVCCQGQLFPKLGTMERMTAHEAWHSPLMTEIRRHHATDTAGKIACRNCDTTRGVVP
jgi:wyosine [tRNA(Phe)-imidazoG37] synthetase (radical SAM superfamily)